MTIGLNRPSLVKKAAFLLRLQQTLADSGLDEGLHKGLHSLGLFWLVLEYC
jgi:hypothetical protein